MNLFDNLCNDIIEEMAAPKRGGVGVPGSVLKEPGFAKKEKFGGQAGKYTGAQMLQFLGEFLKDRADSEMDYQDLKDSVRNFLKNRGFGGTAAEYWTRTLSQTIFDFGYKPEKPSEVNDDKDSEKFDSEDVPEIVDSGETTEQPTSDISSNSEQPEPSNTPATGSEEEAAELGLSDIENAVLTAVEGEGPIDNNALVKVVDRDLIPQRYKDSEDSIKSYLRQIAQGLGRKKLIKRSDAGWEFIPQSTSGSTLSDLGDEDEQQADIDRAKQAAFADLQRQMMGGMTSRSPLEDSVNFSDIYLNAFKSKSLIKE